jgi:predicted O-linked N-acetylglucosamine transferase (SPINDLY family)
VFRTHVTRAFAAEGVPAERLVFRAVRGAHLRFYDEVDITLDTFPLTGGTTTVEALWMGAPVISLKGEAFYERLSWSILANLGLEELVADDLAGYQAAALKLAADRARRAELRATLRTRLRRSPLGDTEQFAADFFALARAFADA